MTVDHIALWTERLEELRAFYVRYFDGTSNAKYTNSAKGFESYFIRFDNGARLELMRRSDLADRNSATRLGLCHFAFGCASREEVLSLTERLRGDGIAVVGEPRTSGDGYFESVVEDPDGNRVELVFKPNL